MRRFLINRIVVQQGERDIRNLGFGCEMWETGPVATIETLPPFRTRWFMSMDNVKDLRVWRDARPDLFEGSLARIDIYLVDEREEVYWQHQMMMFHVDVSSLDPKVLSFIDYPLPNESSNAEQGRGVEAQTEAEKLNGAGHRADELALAITMETPYSQNESGH